ncbi:hypothetical protein DIPPA_70118 [Diplonema papillatum]|uniref:Glucokinase n=1 Tax=Diplonema papillatum TaxID=91374 RepID=A0A0B6VM20_9EUGL|nr:hypothetical protein DIPPA_70118 [Diplonema papillatum]BAQ25438.1 glucokinase [Diplonema papillatum]
MKSTADLPGSINGGQAFVAIDIGASNTRIAVKGVDGKGGHIKRKVNSKPALFALLNEANTAFKKAGIVVLAAGVAGPGPRSPDGTRLGPFSNYTSEDQHLYRDELPSTLCPKGKTVLLNDLEAAAYGVAGVAGGNSYSSYFSKMWGTNTAFDLRNGPCLVVAPGTGLGCGLIYMSESGKPSVMCLEFGHSSLAADAGDEAWLRQLATKVYTKPLPVEWEDVVSGRGLVACWYRCALDAKLIDASSVTDAGQVAQRALDGCPVAGKAMWLHYKYALAFASDLVMGFVCGSVVFTGDNIVNNQFYLGKSDVVSDLQNEFMSHTSARFGFHQKVSVYRQTQSVNLNLEGAFFKAKAFMPVSKL